MANGSPQALADPDRQTQPPPAGAFAGDPAAWLARATAANYVQGQAAAIEILREAERRFPNDARLPAMRADLAYQLDRRDEVEEALERAKAIDPDEPSALLVDARYRATVFSDLDGALATLQHAAEVAPGADAVWNEIGIVQSDRNAIIEADAAHRKAIALNPENPVLYANYARFLMDNDQLDAAKAGDRQGRSARPQCLSRAGRQGALPPAHGQARRGRAGAARSLRRQSDLWRRADRACHRRLPAGRDAKRPNRRWTMPTASTPRIRRCR